MIARGEKFGVVVVGYQPVESVLTEDYTDFKIGTKFSWMELKNMTKLGVLPPGLLVQGLSFKGNKSQICAIRGSYGSEQWAEPV